MTFPALIKPTARGNGDGIELFENPAALVTFCYEHAGSEELIVQSFVPGYDIDCSVLCRDGKILAYTIQKSFFDGYRRFGPPAGVNFLHHGSTLEVVESLVEKLRFSGVAHIDLRYDARDKQVKVIEINPRFWGSVIGSLMAGVNFPYLACLAGLGIDFPDIEYQPLSYVSGVGAVRLLFDRLTRRIHSGLRFDRTGLEFTIRDPMPEVLGRCIKMYRKLMRKVWPAA